MFQLMKDQLYIKNSAKAQNFIFDRSHLGELIYAPLYRKYNGSYVLDIEKKYVNFLKDNLIMFVFVNDANIIFNRDDGLSFYKNKEDVQLENDMFKNAFYKSNIIKKHLIYVGTKSPEEIHNEIKKILNETN